MSCRDPNDVVRFLAGDAPADEAEAFEAHVDGCPDCRALVTELGRALDVDEEPADELGWVARSGAELVEPGARVGRYVVLEAIGAGAMGVVYRAYDPELDRDVALKLVRVLGEETSPERARGRLVREAQAMARLAHPNVVAVYDASALGEHVFVAMELVDGVDLQTWLAEHPGRSWPALAAMFAEAGRGLAAAHRAGIVHRDFKPANVLVGADRRLRVTDFGLSAVEAGVARGSPRDPGSKITADGTVVGTPAYMSPEVAAGAAGDERSDQYSFCVALYEAVVGARPGDLARAPARLRALLARGLAEDPGARFPTMDALVEALDGAIARARAPRARTLVPVAAIVVAAVAGYVGYRLAAAPAEELGCEPPDLAGIWDPARKTALRDAFGATGAPGADDTWRRVEAALDDTAATLARDHAATCEAYAGGTEPEALRDLRLACLDGELARLRAVLAMLAAPDAAIVRNAIASTDLVGRLAACRDVARLRQRPPLPVDPVTRVRLAAATAELARIEVASARGRYAEAQAGARRIVDDAIALGDPHLEASALISLGESTWRAGDLAGAERLLHRGIEAAKRAGAPDLEGGALLTLVAVLGWEDGRYDEALQLARLAEATLATVGDDERRGKLAGNRAAIAWARGDLAGAAADFRRSHELLVRALGPDDRRVGQATMNLALVEAEPGDAASLQRALPLYARALAIFEARLGPRHPEVALTVGNRAIAYANLGRHADAMADVERALAIRREQLGPHHRDVAMTLRLAGEIELERGRHEPALARFREAAEVYAKALRPDHPELASVENSVGRTLLALGRDREAIAPLERALERYAAAKIETSAVAQTRFALARALWPSDRRRARELLAAARRGLAAHPDDLAELAAWEKAHP